MAAATAPNLIIIRRFMPSSSQLSGCPLSLISVVMAGAQSCAPKLFRLCQQYLDFACEHRPAGRKCIRFDYAKNRYDKVV
jgi:hypothetical protein